MEDELKKMEDNLKNKWKMTSKIMKKCKTNSRRMENGKMKWKTT
jgi:hypothetical protein